MANAKEKNRRGFILSYFSKSGISVLVTCVILLQSTAGNNTSTDDQTQHKRCKAWVTDENVRHVLEAGRKIAPPCPCHEEQIVTDMSFDRSDRCYIQLFFSGGVKQKCCYNKSGLLLIGNPRGGYLVFEDMHTSVEEAFSDCCQGNSALCELFYTINPSDDCSRFEVSTRTTSWGDPQITTVDNHTYTFNGHGEYIYLDINNGTLMIQVRTEYLEPGNIDATVFTAFAFSLNNNDTVNFIVEKKGSEFKVKAYFRRNEITTYLQTPGGFYIIRKQKYREIGIRFQGKTKINQIEQIRDSKVYSMFLRPKAEIIEHDFFKSTEERRTDDRDKYKQELRKRGIIRPWQLIIVKYDKTVRISIDHKPSIYNSSCVGLAGLTRNGNFVNKTSGGETKINSSSSEIFDFGESWMLKTENESLFDYTLTNKTFQYYNSNHTRPFFPEDYLNNLTVMFNVKGHHNESDIENFKQKCEDYPPCLTEIARTDSIDTGIQVLEEHKRILLEEKKHNNKPPEFTDAMPKTIKVTAADSKGFNINLTQYVTDDQDEPGSMNYTVDTNINSVDYTLVNGVFSWTNISELFRSTDASIIFFVRDRWNFPAQAQPTIIYCGCKNESQCNFNESRQVGAKFRRASCDCESDKFAEGLFCEKDVPPCLVVQCDPLVTCHNVSTNKINPCGKCPEGYSGNGMSCMDIDECDPKYEGEYCLQNCTNYEGGYTCSCRHGYQIEEDNKTCSDINECDVTPDPCFNKENKRCRNLPGEHECICLPNFYQGEDGACKKGWYSYIGSLSLTITESRTTLSEPEKTNITNTLMILFHKVKNFVTVKVEDIEFNSMEKRAKRRASYSRPNKVRIIYKIITRTPTNTTNLEQDIRKSVTEALKNGTFTLFGVYINTENITIFNESANKLCEYDTRICDPVTTHCKEKNGTTYCACNDGFTKSITYATFCHDVNECRDETLMATKCYKGSCRNTHGSWECVCPDRLTLKFIGNDSYRCEGDHQYIGNISLVWRTEFSEIEIINAVEKMLNVTFSNSSSNTSVGLEMYKLFLKAEIINSTFLYSNKSHDVSLRYILHIGEPLYWTEVSHIQKMDFNLTSWNNTTYTFKNTFIYNETEVSICDIEEIIRCDTKSTLCVSTQGTAECKCKIGYVKDERSKNSKFCTDVNECQTGAECLKGICTNTDGSWECTCDKYSAFNRTGGMNGTCTDIDECKTIGQSFCGQNGTCVNLDPGWNCLCPEGYSNRTLSENLHECADIDECLYKNCTNRGTCRNFVGSWTCDCFEGFRLNVSSMSCDDINECELLKNICVNGECHNTIGSYTCNCSKGFQFKDIGFKFCADIDECMYKNCTNGGICRNSIGNWTCECPEGFRLNATSVTCEDVNECNDAQFGYPACLESTGCIDLDGSWQCLCRFGNSRPLNSTTKICGGEYQYGRSMGFALISSSEVNFTDLRNELQKKLQQMYVEVISSVSISIEIIDIRQVRAKRETRNLSSDWTVDFVVHSNVAINKTTLQTVMTIYSGKCQNSSCPEEDIGQYMIHMDPTLKDLKLCKTRKNYCNSASTNCSDVDDKINCNCQKGFEKVSESSCEDINECSNQSSFTCSGNVSNRINVCQNVPGNWSCSCQDGYYPQRINESLIKCEDINECKDGSKKYVCEAYDKTDGNVSFCSNKEGGWSCNCKPGYKRITLEAGKKYKCKYGCGDSPCLNDGICENVNDEFVCTCSAGWKGKFCDVTAVDPEASHLKTVLIASCSAAAGVMVLLSLAIFGLWRHRFSQRSNKEERISLNTIGSPDSWQLRNGTHYISPDDKASSNSDRASRRLSIPRPQLGKSEEDLHAYERHDQQNPAPDYHLHFPSGLINLAPDYRTEDSPVMRRQRKGLPQKPRPESLNYISNEHNYHRSASNRNSLPNGLTNAQSYL